MTRAPAALGLVFSMLWGALTLHAEHAEGARAESANLECSGADTMKALTNAWAAGLAKAGAGIRVEVDEGTRLSADGFISMLAGRANCAMFARELFPGEAAAYVAHYGREPLVIPVATGSHSTLHATHAIAIYVNADNPLTRLTVPELTRIFEAAQPDGGPGTPLTWGEFEHAPGWANRPVHVYGMTPWRASGNPPGIVNYLERRMMRGRPFRSDMRIPKGTASVPPLQAIVDHVASDPDGIGYSGFGFARGGTKTIALASRSGATYYAGSPQAVADRRYPLSRTIYLVFPPGPDGRAMPAARRLLHFALSWQGQSMVGSTREHFSPLTPDLLGRARHAIDIASTRVTDAGIARLPPYQPRKFHFPDEATYRQGDGTVTIVGYNDMRGMLAAWNILFTATHPGARFRLNLPGTRMAPPALMRGHSAFAPMGAPFEPGALSAYKAATGSAPLPIRVAHAALDPHARSSPLAVYVNRANPLAQVDMATLSRLFSDPALQHWGDLGLTGAWALRRIHRYGLAPSTALGAYFSARVLAGRRYEADFAGARESRRVIQQVARDPLGVGFADLNQAMSQVKALALAPCPRCKPLPGSRTEIITGRYPLDRYLFIYVRQPVDPFVREYLRLVLSREGQRALSTVMPHYIPLSEQQLREQRRLIAVQARAAR